MFFVSYLSSIDAIRGTVAHDLQIGSYFGDDGEPIDEEKVDIVESLIDKFFVE